MALQIITNTLVTLIAFLHLYFLVLEMFLWTKPYGRKAFGTSEDFAIQSATLAANQGLYNGFLAAGLLSSFFLKNPEVTYAFQMFFTACVIMAGAYGGMTVNRRIFFIQGLPAIVAFACVLFLRF